MDQLVRHRPVLAAEVVCWLNVEPDGIFVDCTAGEGGHARMVADKLGPEGQVVLVDRDASPLEAAVRRVAAGQERPQVTAVHATFDRIDLIEPVLIGPPTAVLMDLGVSSNQLDDPGRGLSYREEGPLDMRLDQSQELTAADIVNGWGERRLAEVIGQYGEERFAGRIARAITAARRRQPITTTTRLAEIVKDAIPAATRRTGPHPARRTFQAIRIAVNDELKLLERALADWIELLKAGGRLVTIAYHSLEDRICKQVFARLSGCTCPPGLPVCCCQGPAIEVLTRKPVTPNDREVADNPRARSARLRSIRKIEARSTGHGG